MVVSLGPGGGSEKGRPPQNLSAAALQFLRPQVGGNFPQAPLTGRIRNIRGLPIDVCSHPRAEPDIQKLAHGPIRVDMAAPQPFPV